MSIKLTTQMDWMHYASFSKNHPDNLTKTPDVKLPVPPVAPPPVTSFTESEKVLRGAWGHKLSSEQPYGKVETTTRIKGDVTPKIGHHWGASVHAEKGRSVMQSAMYSGSLREPSFGELINNGVSFVR